MRISLAFTVSFLRLGQNGWTGGAFPLLAQRRSIAPPKLSFLPFVEDSRVGGTLWQRGRDMSYIDPDEIN
jgi:hypothetical protein